MLAMPSKEHFVRSRRPSKSNRLASERHPIGRETETTPSDEEIGTWASYHLLKRFRSSFQRLALVIDKRVGRCAVESESIGRPNIDG